MVSLKHVAKRLLLESPAGRYALILPRICMAIQRSGAIRRILCAVWWGFQSRDIGARSYHTGRDNQDELCAVVSSITKRSIKEIFVFRDEILSDSVLADHVTQSVRTSSEKWSHDDEFRIGRRLAYYLLVRALRPNLVFEAGTDRGLTALLVSRALERNRQDGFEGDYVGAEINVNRRPILYESYPRRTGRIYYGDSIDILNSLKRPPRSDHSRNHVGSQALPGTA